MKLLFIMDTFPLGGIAKSLLALFNELGGKHDIDFLLMKQEGLFMPLIPNTINLLSEPIEYPFRNPHPKNILKNLSALSFRRWIKWVSYSLKCCIGRLTGGLHRHIQVMDVWLGKNSNATNQHYDAAIAYQGGRCIYYLVENVDAKVKIGYVHSDYAKNETDYMLKATDTLYFPQLDYIATISNECVASLMNEFPKIKEKFKKIENICSPTFINKLANNGETYDDGFKGIRIATMGRFDIKTKGFDLAVEASRILNLEGIDFRWYVLGDGDERQVFERMIIDSGLEKRFILLGAKINPYPFIKDADIYVQPSRVEGKSVALDEVKALAKPTVVTNFSTVYDQFVNNWTALICEMKSADIADKIMLLINNVNLRNELSNNLKNERVGNEDQADALISLIYSKLSQ